MVINKWKLVQQEETSVMSVKRWRTTPACVGQQIKKTLKKEGRKNCQINSKGEISKLWNKWCVYMCHTGHWKWLGLHVEGRNEEPRCNRRADDRAKQWDEKHNNSIWIKHWTTGVCESRNKIGRKRCKEAHSIVQHDRWDHTVKRYFRSTGSWPQSISQQ